MSSNENVLSESQQLLQVLFSIKTYIFLQIVCLKYAIFHFENGMKQKKKFWHKMGYKFSWKITVVVMLYYVMKLHKWPILIGIHNKCWECLDDIDYLKIIDLKTIYVTPANQFSTGVEMSLERKQQLIALAQ